MTFGDAFVWLKVTPDNKSGRTAFDGEAIYSPITGRKVRLDGVCCFVCQDDRKLCYLHTTGNLYWIYLNDLTAVTRWTIEKV